MKEQIADLKRDILQERLRLAKQKFDGQITFAKFLIQLLQIKRLLKEV